MHSSNFTLSGCRSKWYADLSDLGGLERMSRWLLLSSTHIFCAVAGFALGVYTLPILMAPPGPDSAAFESTLDSAIYRAPFERNFKGSDFLHWGEGEVRVLKDRVAHLRRLAPGRDYKLYLTPTFVDSKEAFLQIKQESKPVGDVKTFNGFLIDLPPDADIERYVGVVVWCEAFSQFITSAQYR